MNSRTKIRIAVIMGGPSAERKISIASGTTIARELDPSKYHVLPIVIDDRLRWLPAPKLLTSGTTGRQAIAPTAEPKTRPFDVALLALHSYGEDGSVQGFLETLNIPYTGSGILASALAMDKARFKLFCRSLGLPTARGLLIERDFWTARRSPAAASIRRLASRVVVKPNASGSSAATAIVNSRNTAHLQRAISAALRIGSSALVEEFLEGEEFTVATIGDEQRVRALPVIQIVPTKDTFFSYRVKYDGSTKEICPAPISRKLARTLSDLAVAVHLGIGASGLIRTDFIVRRGRPYILEANTLPGMTPESLAPKAAAAAGMSYRQLLDELIRIAQRRHA